MVDEHDRPGATSERDRLLKRGIIEDGRPILAQLDYAEERRQLARRRRIRAAALALLAWCERQVRHGGE